MKNIETILYHDIKRYAIRLCKGNIHDAEDAVQDLAERISKDIEYYLSKAYSDLRAIIFDELKLVMWRRQRYESAKKRTPVETYSAKTIENDAWGLLEKRELQSALLKLSKTQSTYFRLRLEGYNLYEIGDMFSRDPSGIHTTINTAKKNIIKQLN